MHAAIIIPHYNDVARLVRCLDALMPQVREGDEVIVVDNGSSADLSPVHKAWPDLRVVIEHQKGAACARNRGVAETSAPWLFFIDSDCLPAHDWVATAHRLCAAPPGDLIGGQVTVFDETPAPRSGAEAFETVFAFDFRNYIEQKGFSGSGNLLTRRDVFEATGPFKPGLSEDLEWCRRATSKGFRLVYAEDLRVGHPTRSDWTALARKWQRLTQEEKGLTDKSATSRLRWILKALAMPVSVVAHAPRVLFHPGLSDARERARALGTLARLRFARMIWMLRSD